MESWGTRTNPNDRGAAAGDRALREARAVIVGAGGLGCPAALGLAAAGVGTLAVLDPDVVELSNLNRQILHGTRELGTAKVSSLRERLRSLYPDTRVEAHRIRLTTANLPAFFGPADFVIDATDGVEAKFLVNDGAVSAERPYCHAGILGFQGQVMTVLPRRTTCYRCLFPEPPPGEETPTCRDAGILGAVAGVIGAVQAAEAIKYLSGRTGLLTDRILIYDGRTGGWRTAALRRNPRCPVCGKDIRGRTYGEAGTETHGS